MSGGGEVKKLRLQVGQLQQQLAQEQHLRRQAEEAGEAAAADRARLQRARDELATALLLAEKRAQDAEEEQLRAEEQAVALAQQLREATATAEAAGGGAAQPAAAPATTVAAAAAEKDSKRLQADLEVMLAALDQERHRSEELVRTLEAAEREAVSATEQLLKAKQKLKQRDSRSGDSKAPTISSSGGGVQASASGTSLAVVEGLPPGAHGEAAVALLQQRIAALKASRDKLIAAFDAQAAEVERLSTDNAALAESLVQLREVATNWEAQAQDSLAQNERLKDLLEESATWSIPALGLNGSSSSGAAAAAADGGKSRVAGVVAGAPLGPADQAAAAASEGVRSEAGAAAGAPAAAAGGSEGDATAGLAELCQRFERELLLEKAKSAQLDLQVRALCMELTRAAHSSSQMQAALLPMLGGIEARLVQVLGMRPRQAALQPAAMPS